ncbi:MAG: stage V sporulation protein SpoVM [Acutalibacteraceae bacterium]|nr:stage V sporulation protein SpoVM [Acutalibacteraceae bacterium]
MNVTVKDLGNYISHNKQTVLGGKFMKIVVIKSPKFLSGILRTLFGIKKQAD